MSPRYGQIDTRYGRRLASTPPDEEGPLWMVNLMSYRTAADYADGRDSAISGREADDMYTPTGPLAAVGGEIVFVGDVQDQFLGADPKWDRVAVVKYPTRRSFIDMQQRDDFHRQPPYLFFSYFLNYSVLIMSAPLKTQYHLPNPFVRH